METIRLLGGSARVSKVVEMVPRDEKRSPEKHTKLVRGYIRYLAKQGYVRRVRRGLWTLSDKGKAVIAKEKEASADAVSAGMQ